MLKKAANHVGNANFDQKQIDQKPVHYINK